MRRAAIIVCILTAPVVASFASPAAAQKLAPLVLEISERDETRQFLKTFAGEPFAGDAAAFAKMCTQTGKDWEYFVKFAKIDAQ
jgi:hypothetical protein